MKTKPTGELEKELMQPNLNAYIRRNQEFFQETDALSGLENICRRSKLTKSALARQAGMSEVYLHQVFSGRRRPSRDRLLCLCVALSASAEETQDLLKQNGYAQLYPKCKRDAILLHGIIHQTELGKINDTLFAENEKTLF